MNFLDMIETAAGHVFWLLFAVFFCAAAAAAYTLVECL
jgi:hypothetical protein